MDKLLLDLSGYQTTSAHRVSARDEAATLGLILPRPQPSRATMAAASVGFSTIDALENLASSIPGWNQQLDGLNGQIADRQVELARLDECEAPPKSIRNKGSTESLRPKEGNENPFHSDDDDNILKQCHINKPNTPRQSSSFDSPRKNASPTSPSAARLKSKTSQEFQLQTPSPKAHSNPRQYPRVLPQQSNQPTPPAQVTPRQSPAVLRKRKTDSLASGESAVPKYRTRSMIIVYYDSAVQTAFEELVKFISASRNAMRKGKMAVKMAEIQRAADSEADGEAEGEDGDNLDVLAFRRTLRAPLRAARDKVSAHGSEPRASLTNGPSHKSIDKLSQIPNAALDLSPDPSADPDTPVPQLRFVSTRRMGPTRDGVSSMPGSSPLPGQRVGGMLQGFRRGGMNDATDIFDELDNGLEYCQIQCERAAHQFLRDGECATEIENIKARLREVRSKAEKEVEVLKSSSNHVMKSTTNGEKGADENGRKSEDTGNGVALTMESSTEEKDGMMQELEVDDMEVGDEEIEVPQLVWKKARDIVR